MGEDLEVPLVRTQGLRKTFVLGAAAVHALRGVSFAVGRGELVAIMGSSGSGKSTLLNVLGTLDRPEEGQYWLDGERVDALGDAALSELRNRKLGFVFQQFNLLPRESALANVELPLVYARERPKVRREKAERALARVGLADRMDHLPTQLSGGQQQRVAIARAIVNEPVLLLADEPTGALDSATSRQVMELFLQLHAQGMTVVLVTHDAGVAQYAQRVVSFKDGEIVSDVKGEGHARDLARGPALHVA